MSDGLRLVLAALATWRVTHLIAYEDGPWDVISRLRNIAGSGFWGKLMDCFYCLSLWVSALVTWALQPNRWDVVWVWLGLSGAACLLNRIGSAPVRMEPVMEEGDDHGMLRTEPGESAHGRSASGGSAS